MIYSEARSKVIKRLDSHDVHTKSLVVVVGLGISLSK
jgi:hypothetical protein